MLGDCSVLLVGSDYRVQSDSSSRHPREAGLLFLQNMWWASQPPGCRDQVTAVSITLCVVMACCHG